MVTAPMSGQRANASASAGSRRPMPSGPIRSRSGRSWRRAARPDARHSGAVSRAPRTANGAEPSARPRARAPAGGTAQIAAAVAVTAVRTAGSARRPVNCRSTPPSRGSRASRGPGGSRCRGAVSNRWPANSRSARTSSACGWSRSVQSSRVCSRGAAPRPGSRGSSAPGASRSTNRGGEGLEPSFSADRGGCRSATDSTACQGTSVSCRVSPVSSRRSRKGLRRRRSSRAPRGSRPAHRTSRARAPVRRSPVAAAVRAAVPSTPGADRPTSRSPRRRIRPLMVNSMPAPVRPAPFRWGNPARGPPIRTARADGCGRAATGHIRPFTRRCPAGS